MCINTEYELKNAPNEYHYSGGIYNTPNWQFTSEMGIAYVRGLNAWPRLLITRKRSL